MKTNSPFPLVFKSPGRYLRRRSVLSFLLLAILCSSVSAQNSANIIIQPASPITIVGQSFTVTARVDMISGEIDDAEVHLTFDKTKLQVTSITKPSSGIMPNEAIPLQAISTINTNGQINYNAGTTSSFPTADFDLLSITFSAIAGGGTTTPLTYLTNFPNKTNAWRGGPSILNATSGATVTIQNCTPPTATIAGPSAASTCNGQPVGLKLSAATGTSPYTLVVNGTSYPGVTVGSTFASVPFPTYNFWTSAPTPVQLNNFDGQSIEVGVKFKSNVAGFIKGIRYYVGSSGINQSHTVKLWNAGTSGLMGSATFTPGAGGWQQVLFSSPISIAANTTYIASCFSLSGYYNETDNVFSSAITNGPLTIVQDGGGAAPNGIYKYGAGMPNTGFAATNYCVDVVFTQNTNSFNLTSVTDATGCTNAGSLQTLNVTSIDCSTLPVTLLNLSASPIGRKVTLRWSTATEINNRGFDVQRSDDGATWKSIGYVAGAGNSTTTTNYTYIDDNLEARKYYYRLNQTDIDGRSKYSVIVSAVIGSKGEYALSQNYPNPFTNETTIQYTIARPEQVNISLFDMSGRTIKVLVNASKEAGTHAISFHTGSLTRGIYYYRIQAGDFTDVKKLTIQ